MIELSIIIVNYNSKQFLRNCLDSIYQHITGVEFEIIVVDNASSEDIKEFAGKYRTVRWLFNVENLGFAKANNQAVKYATGKYLLLLNNDTILLNNCIENLIKYLKSASSSTILGVKLLNADMSRQSSCFLFPNALRTVASSFFLNRVFKKSSKLNKYYLDHVHLIGYNEVDVVTGAFMFMETERFRFLQGFDEQFYFYGEEIDLCFRHKAASGKVVYYADEAIVHYGGGSTPSLSKFKFINEHFAYVRIMQKHLKGVGFCVAITSHYIGLILRILIFFILGSVLLRKDLIKRAGLHAMQLFRLPSVT